MEDEKVITQTVASIIIQFQFLLIMQIDQT